MTIPDYHVSPSQQVTYIYGCARLWAFAYIWGLKEPGSAATDRGHQVHKVLEDWTTKATPPDLDTLIGRIAKPAIKHIPAPMTPGVFAEAEVHMISPLGNHFMFLKDLEQPAGPIARIWDYKSTSNLKYAHTTEELLNTDPQGIIYPAHRFLESPDVLQVRSDWLYLPTSQPHYCHVVPAVHEKEHCLARFSLLDRVAGHMLNHRRQKTNPLAFAPNPGHCRAFNRECPHTGKCNLSELEKMIAMNNQAMGPASLDFLAQINRAAADSGPVPGTGAPPVTSIPQPPAQPAFALANLGGAPAAPPPPPPPAFIPPAPVAPPAPVFSPPVQLAPAAPAAPVMPWALPQPPVAPTIVEPAPIDVRQMPFNEAAPPPSPAKGPDVAQVTNFEPPKRKRRSKAEMEAARAAVAAGTATEEQQSDITAQVNEEGEVVYPGVADSQAEMLKKAIVNLGANVQTGPGIVVPESYSEEPLLVRIAIAMAHNPGYCALDSVSFAVRARAIAAAVQEEEAGL